MFIISTYTDEGKGIRFKIGSLEGPPYLKEYLNYLLAVKNASQKTASTYYVQIRLFLRWIATRDKVDGMSVEEFYNVPIANVPFALVAETQTSDIISFLTFSQTFLGNSPSTRSSKLAALSSFFRYHVETTKMMDHYPTAVISAPKVGKRVPKYLSKEDCLRLLDAVQGYETERDYCMITFFLNIGMRLSELVGIDLKDIRDGRLLLRGKGNKERVVYLNDACLDALDQWMVVRKLVDEEEKLDPLFISRRTKLRLSPRRVEKIIENTLIRSGLAEEGVSTHTLRHTAATLMYDEGAVDILVLQEILGHSSPSTTRIYTHLNSKQVKNTMRSSPLAGVRRNTPYAEQPQNNGDAKAEKNI